jgi:hypothetical protein
MSSGKYWFLVPKVSSITAFVKSQNPRAGDLSVIPCFRQLSWTPATTTQVNVTFHTISAIATAAFLSSTQSRPAPDAKAARPSLLIGLVGFVAGVVEHGVMDYVPHSYSIPSGMDVVFSIILFAVAVALTKPQFRILVTACFIGSIFPDLVDLGPAILNRHLGWSLPTARIFPWHWPQYSGSLYHGAKRLQSALSHSLVIGVCVGVCCFYRHSLFASASERT